MLSIIVICNLRNIFRQFMVAWLHLDCPALELQWKVESHKSQQSELLVKIHRRPLYRNNRYLSRHYRQTVNIIDKYLINLLAWFIKLHFNLQESFWTQQHLQSSRTFQKRQQVAVIIGQIRVQWKMDCAVRVSNPKTLDFIDLFHYLHSLKSKWNTYLIEDK